MNIKKFKLSAFIFLVICSACFSMINTGEKIPDFKIEDVNGKVLTAGMLRGKLTVGFYTDKDTAEKNISFENYLNSLKKEKSPTPVFRLAVTDATEANFLTRPLWEKAIRGKSAERKVDIYCDWEGKFKKSFGLPEKESTFMIIDKNGTLRYIFSGKVPETDFKKITALLENLAVE